MERLGTYKRNSINADDDCIITLDDFNTLDLSEDDDSQARKVTRNHTRSFSITVQNKPTTSNTLQSQHCPITSKSVSNCGTGTCSQTEVKNGSSRPSNSTLEDSDCMIVDNSFDEIRVCAATSRESPFSNPLPIDKTASKTSRNLPLQEISRSPSPNSLQNTANKTSRSLAQQEISHHLAHQNSYSLLNSFYNANKTTRNLAQQDISHQAQGSSSLLNNFDTASKTSRNFPLQEISHQAQSSSSLCNSNSNLPNHHQSQSKYDRPINACDIVSEVLGTKKTCSNNSAPPKPDNFEPSIVISDDDNDPIDNDDSVICISSEDESKDEPKRDSAAIIANSTATVLGASDVEILDLTKSKGQRRRLRERLRKQEILKSVVPLNKSDIEVMEIPSTKCRNVSKKNLHKTNNILSVKKSNNKFKEWKRSFKQTKHKFKNAIIPNILGSKLDLQKLYSESCVIQTANSMSGLCLNGSRSCVPERQFPSSIWMEQPPFLLLNPVNNLPQLNLPVPTFGLPLNPISNSDLLNKEYQPRQTLRPIAIDGSNVAFAHGKKSFSAKGILLAVQLFKERGHKEVKVFLPMFRKENVGSVVPDDVIVYTPSRNVNGNNISSYDDRFIIEYATSSGAVILSNDRYKDLIGENPKWDFVIRTRLLMYSFADDLLMLPKDPFGRWGICLDNLLMF